MARCAAIVLIFLSFLGAGLARAGLSRYPIPGRHDPEQAREMLFIPSPALARAVSLGYRNAVADLLWFKTIAYFGSHIEGDRNVSRLDTLCSSIMALNPHAQHVAVFCAQMLAWELNQPERAHHFLTIAIHNQPNDWMLYYLRGFFSLHFSKNTRAAADDLGKAASYPDCHPVVKRLAAKHIAALEGPQSAIAFIDILIDTETDTQTRKTLQKRRQELKEKLQDDDAAREKNVIGERGGTNE